MKIIAGSRLYCSNQILIHDEVSKLYKKYLAYVFRVMLLVVPCLVAMVVDQSNQLGINKRCLQRHTRVILTHNSRVWGVLVSMNCSNLWSAHRTRET